jgi:drug/metabolite transporter (DMT)-like permease
MGWILLALLSATGKAAGSLVNKVLLRRHGALRLACVTHLSAAVAVAPLVLIPGLLSLSAVASIPAFHGWSWLTIAGNVAAIWMLNLAIARSDLSVALPFLALTPPLTLLTGWALVGERASALGTAGVLVAAAGAFGVGARGWGDWARGGGRRIFRDRGVQLALGVAAIYSITAVADQQAARLGGPLTFLWYGALGRGLCFTLIWLALHRRWRRRSAAPVVGRDRLLLAAVVVTLVLEHLAHLYALTLGLVSYVVTIKRVHVLETSLAGWWLFGEPFTRYRLLGALLLVAGAALVSLT